MNQLMPRLDRTLIDLILDDLLEHDIEKIAESMPLPGYDFTYAPVGGLPMRTETLDGIRKSILDLARDHGYPESRRQSDLRSFDTECARILHNELEITAHEAGHREVWACFTTAHLLDIAVWRWGEIRDRNRVNGDLNRDTFRRLWWRAEMLHEPNGSWDDLRDLGEDEFVAILERPVVTGNPLIARTIVRCFRSQLQEEHQLEPLRMRLMRETMKRLTRITPFILLDFLSESEIEEIVLEHVRAAAEVLLDSNAQS
jgi:hypothetical protein